MGDNAGTIKGTTIALSQREFDYPPIDWGGEVKQWGFWSSLRSEGKGK